MASGTHRRFLLPFILIFLLRCTEAATTGNFTAIFSLGDSLTDTGNCILFPGGTDQAAGKFPYGKTYFHRPTGRFCDGRIIPDFIAQAFGLPFVRSYLAGGSADDFRHGANLAVGGATTLDHGYFASRGVNASWVKSTLRDQRKWLRQMLHLLHNSNPAGYRDILSKSLFLMGEIGVNDYDLLLPKAKAKKERRALVRHVVHEIGLAIRDLISHGAKTVMVEGIFPLGCIAYFLTVFQSEKAEHYDPRTGCLKWLNEFSEYHNEKLLQKIGFLQKLHPETKIIYADIYVASMSIYQSPKTLGFKVPLGACCGGGGGPYNFEVSISCGDLRSKSCSDPSKHTSWDGRHLTEAAYKVIAGHLLKGLLAETKRGLPS